METNKDVMFRSASVHLYQSFRLSCKCQRLAVKFYAKGLPSDTSFRRKKKKLSIRHFHRIKKFLKRGLSFQVRNGFVVYSKTLNI